MLVVFAVKDVTVLQILSAVPYFDGIPVYVTLLIFVKGFFTLKALCL